MARIIEVVNQALNAELARLSGQLEHPGEALKPIGEDIVERMKQRFASATGPDGVRWKVNSRVTLMRYIMGKNGFSKKTGKISAKGRSLAISKRPLQGESGRLAENLNYSAQDDALTVNSIMEYAFMQHFGGTKAMFRHLWGNIPARPFFPINAAGELYPADADRIIDQLRQYLEGSH